MRKVNLSCLSLRSCWICASMRRANQTKHRLLLTSCMLSVSSLTSFVNTGLSLRLSSINWRNSCWRSIPVCKTWLLRHSLNYLSSQSTCLFGNRKKIRNHSFVFWSEICPCSWTTCSFIRSWWFMRVLAGWSQWFRITSTSSNSLMVSCSTRTLSYKWFYSKPTLTWAR